MTIEKIYIDSTQHERGHAHEIEKNMSSVEEVVAKVLEYRKQDYIATYKEEYTDYFKEDAQRDRITKLENAFRQDTLPTNWDAYEPAGGIRLSSNPQEIDAYVQEKFFSLRQSGLLLRRSEFEQMYDAKKFREPGHHQKQDLTRLWGAEYLRKKLADKDNYAVPRFFIVLNDNASTLPITVVKDYMSVIIGKCDTKVAEVVVENINGVANCTASVHGWMRTLGYVDYSDAGNIRQGSDGKFYVVDTEWKSLDGVTTLFNESLSTLDPTITQLRRYANERFQALYGDEWKKIVNVNLSFQ